MKILTINIMIWLQFTSVATIFQQVRNRGQTTLYFPCESISIEKAEELRFLATYASQDDFKTAFAG